MVNEVNKIIRNRLLSHGAILLPDVGTLFVVRKGAAMSSKSGVVAPEYRVDFSSTCSATSIVDIIAQSASMSTKNAEDVYMLWLDKVRKDNAVIIDSVGSLRNKSFVADESLTNALNPYMGTVIKITRRRSRVALYLTATIATVASIALLFVLLTPSDDSATEQTTTDVELSEVSTTPIVASNDDVNIEPRIVDETISEEAVDESVEEVTETEVVDNGPWYEREDTKHYVVVGSYTRKRNAERAVQNITKANIQDVECHIFQRDKMYTLAVYGSPDLESCEAFIASHKNDFTQAWVYSIDEK